VPGAQGWDREDAERFRGRRVVVVTDCDKPGRAAANRVARDLAGLAQEVRLLDLDRGRDDGYDIGDFLRDAHTDEERAHACNLVNKLANSAPLVVPDGLVALPASAVQPEPVAWLWEGRVPLGSITLLVGDPGLGKTLMACELAASVSRDGGVVLMASAEDSPATTLVPRLKAAGAALDNVRFVQLRRDGLDQGITLPDDVEALDQLVAKHGAHLLIIDPLMAHLPDAINSFRDQSVRRALTPLYRLAVERGCAVTAVAHLNKGAGGEPLYRVGGSIGFPAAARSVLLLARDPDDSEDGDRRVLAHIKCNLAPLAPSLAYEVETMRLPEDERIETARLKHTGESDYKGSELLGRSTDKGDAVSDASEFLALQLVAGPRPAEEIKAAARDAGVSEKTLERAKKRIGVESDRVGFGPEGVWYWRPADIDGQDADAANGGSNLALYGSSPSGAGTQGIEPAPRPHRTPTPPDDDLWEPERGAPGRAEDEAVPAPEMAA
jgi:hypothetical protein